MKLNLIFIVMDLLTILAYPIVAVHNRLRMLSNQKASVRPMQLATVSSIASGG